MKKRLTIKYKAYNMAFTTKIKATTKEEILDYLYKHHVPETYEEIASYVGQDCPWASVEVGAWSFVYENKEEGLE